MGPTSHFGQAIMEQKYSHTKIDGTKESWSEIARRVATSVMIGLADDYIEDVIRVIEERKFVPGGRYLYAAGRDFHQVNNCTMYRAEDSREGWSDLLRKASMALMSGAGIGVNYSALRENGAPIRKTGGTASGPLSLMGAINEVGRNIKQGGSRRSAIYASLRWDHPDIFAFINAKNWSPEIRAAKEKDYNAYAPFDCTNMSVSLNDAFFSAYALGEHPRHNWALEVFDRVTRKMCTTAEPGFQIDCGENAGEDLRNACTEVTSRDDSDICNLGSINLAQITDLADMDRTVKYATLFLLCGTLYSDVPHAEVLETRAKNRRLGLGLMGIHEFLLKRGLAYAPNNVLGNYLTMYARSDYYAKKYALQLGVSIPIKTRAIAPTGTIGIIAETTTGIEPVFCVAYKRRYLDGTTWKYQYVVDPTAQRLIDSGVDPSSIEDSYTLARDVDRRLEFQAWVGSFVDQAISSTVNLPAWGTSDNNVVTIDKFRNSLLKHLRNLRGVTCYPDGARGGQPIVPVSYELAAANLGKVFIEGNGETQSHTEADVEASAPIDVCDITKGGSCGA